MSTTQSVGVVLIRAQYSAALPREAAYPVSRFRL